MEALFKGNIIFIYFFAMIAIYNYSNLKEYQRITIIYITVYGLVLTNIVGVITAMVMLGVSVFCFFEILTKDEMKFKLVVNPIYKLLDCLYLSFAQYAIMYQIMSIVLCGFFRKYVSNSLLAGICFGILSFILLFLAITSVLQQKYTIKSFDDMFTVFKEFPINKVVFNDKLDQASRILISIEDKRYYQRKGYTDFNIKTAKGVIQQGIDITYSTSFFKKIRYFINWMLSAFRTFRKFLRSFFSRDRGYSTIPMQLIRSLGLEIGYNCQIRRKVYECLYSKIFFDGLREYYELYNIAGRENIKEYLIYIYFHTVMTYLGDAEFSKFLNAFDMQYSKKNKVDIYDCTNEGIFIACMGLSKRSTLLNEYNVDYYTSIIEDVKLDNKKICKMARRMMDRPYNGNYLK